MFWFIVTRQSVCGEYIYLHNKRFLELFLLCCFCIKLIILTCLSLVDICVVSSPNLLYSIFALNNVQNYLRTFNPWIQQKKIDPECEYIKKWVTELKDVPAEINS